MNTRLNKRHEKTGWLIAISVTILFHASLAGALIYQSLGNNHITVYDGDNSINAIMIDMSIVAAPELSLVEDSIEIPEPEEPIIEEPKPEEVVEEVIDTQEEVVEVIVDVETAMPAVEPIVKPEPTPKPPKPRQQQPSAAHVRQDVNVENRSDTVTAAKISDNTNYSAIPMPVNRRNPVYPRRALDLRIEGRVAVLFDIDEQGKVTNIRIVEAKPSNIFNRSIIQAMKQWRYEAKPAKDLSVTFVFENGGAVSL